MDPVLFVKTQLLHAALSFITCTFRLNFHVERAVLASAFPARLSPGRLRGSHLDIINCQVQVKTNGLLQFFLRISFILMES